MRQVCFPNGFEQCQSLLQRKRNQKRNLRICVTFIKHIAESLVDDDPDVLEDVNMVAESSNDPSLLLWKGLVNELRGDRPSIQLPVLKGGLIGR